MVNYSEIPNNSKTLNMEQETAVDWLFTTLDNMLELYPSEWGKVSKAVEEAKAMEKEQIVKAFNEGMSNSVQYFGNGVDEAEQYYNETYNK
jgi:predicted HAD superfamily phosphohydrolase